MNQQEQATPVTVIESSWESMVEQQGLKTLVQKIVEEEFGVKIDDVLYEPIQYALVQTVGPMVANSEIQDDEVSLNLGAIEDAIARISEKLGTFVDQVLHNPKFQRVESVWRGIQKVVEEASKNEKMHVSILNADKSELQEDFRQSDIKQTKLYKCAYNQGQGAYRGTPYGAVLLDMQIDPTNRKDMQLIQEATRVAEFGMFPIFAGVSPRFFNENLKGDSDVNAQMPLTKLPDTLSPTRFDGTPWGTFRGDPRSFSVGLLLPRYLGRPLHKRGSDQMPFALTYTEQFNIRDDFLWTNPVYLMGYCLARSFNRCGWFHSMWGDAGIREAKNLGGAIGELPNYVFSDLGIGNLSIPTELQVLEAQNHTLAELGFISLVADAKQTDRAVFFTANSVHQMPSNLKGSNTQQERNYSFNISLAYRLIAYRIGHYAKGLFRMLRGGAVTGEIVQREMDTLVRRYVEAQNIGPLSDQYPIKAAKVIVEETGQAGVYNIFTTIEPKERFAGANIEISLGTVADANP